MRELTKHRQRDVVANGESHDRTLMLTILGHVDNTLGNGLAGMMRTLVVVVTNDMTTIRATDAKNALHQFTATCAHQPVYTENFTAMQIEVDVGKLAFARQLFNSQYFFAKRYSLLGIQLCDGAAHHQGDQLVQRSVTQ